MNIPEKSSSIHHEHMYHVSHRFILRVFSVMTFLLTTVITKAAEDVCNPPEITTSTGSEDLYPGVSTITITADDGDLIFYSIGKDELPTYYDPADAIYDAKPSPVTIEAPAKSSTVYAYAMHPDKTTSRRSDFQFWLMTKSNYTNFSQLYTHVPPAKGSLAGPFYIYALEPLAGSSGNYWISLCQNMDNPTMVDWIVAQIDALSISERPDFKPGDIIDYITINAYYGDNNIYNGGMKLVTSCYLPNKSNPCDTEFPSLTEIDSKPEYWEDYYRMPVILKGVKVIRENNELHIYKPTDTDEMVDYELNVPSQFEGVDMNFDENKKYNLRGIVGTVNLDTSGTRTRQSFFTLSAEPIQGTQTGLADEVIECNIPFVNGRPVLTEGHKLYDLTGRSVNPATATSGIYIVFTKTSAHKIVIK